MIYYFSGTGNSLFVAKKLAENLQLPLCDMAEADSSRFLPTDGVVGFVFPTYAWGVPKVVAEFLEKLVVGEKPCYLFAVFTCGDDMGYTDQVLKRLLQQKSLTLNAAYSVLLRNTYVCLPGFDIDSNELEQRKHLQAEARIEHIAQCVKQKAPLAECELHRGALPWLKTFVVRHLFNTLLINDKHFKVDKNLCTHCQKCVKGCPLQNISISAEQTPQWKGHCTHCLRCYHGCPQHAINYGFFTRHKGQVKING